ncbi:hypothetical protein IMSAGC009_01386 [Lachnospiraceae bacterium]|nr:hypothetical protein IMSAGC009_01386 [Lachnospiraceae bacterium]
MLHNAGYSYISTDITQAFYLTQSYLWEGLFPGCVDECIDSVDDLGRVGAQKMLHIPYWKLWELRNSNLEADIMVSNHALAEMHPRSLRFYLQYGKKLMRNSDYKLFVAQCPGGLIKGNIEYLFDTFNTMGYALLYSENDFIVFSLKDKQGILPADIRGLIKKLSLTPNTYDFPQYQNVLDETASGFYSAEQKIKNETKVSLQELMDFFYSLDGNVDSPDEEFVHYCQYDCI